MLNDIKQFYAYTGFVPLQKKRMPEKRIISLFEEPLTEELQERIDLIIHKLKFVETRPKVCCISGLEPLRGAQEEVSGMIGIAGGTAVLAGNGDGPVSIDPSDLWEADPDIILVAAAGLSIEQTLKEIDVLLQLRGWNDLRAVKDNQVYIADAGQYFQGSDAHVVDSIEILAEIINPRQFVFGYEGNGWLKFSLS